MALFIGRQFGQPIIVAVGPTVFDRDVTSLGISDFNRRRFSLTR
jgi:hypothetical protein